MDFFVGLSIFIAGLAGGYIFRSRGIPFSKKWPTPFTKTIRTYCIAVSHTDDLSSIQTKSRVVLRPEDIFDRNTDVIADPFLICHENGWYMFMEVLNKARDHGEIGVATSADGHTWKYGGIVLTETFHLSFPFVFKEGNDIWMIPETARTKSIRLYRAVDFPYKWTYEKTLLEGKKYTDTSLVRSNGMFWLFSCCNQSRDLLLYHSNTLLGPWHPHRQTPIIYDQPGKARCAGRVVSYKNKLIRFAQDCELVYGRSVSAFAIDIMDTIEYRETPYLESPVLEGSGQGWNAEGMHHLDLHPLGKDRYMAAVDGYSNMKVYGLKY